MRLVAVLLIALVAMMALVGCGGGSSKIVTTASGLKYEEVRIGSGEPAKKGDTVEVHYVGWLTDGTQFDTSLSSQPLRFVLGRGTVIKGWEEGIAGIRLNGQRKLTIPPSLAYGSVGQPPKIPPNATLIFHVQLMNVYAPAEATTPSGLTYIDIVPGEGPTPKTGDLCQVTYTGWLADGTVFDSNTNVQSPFEFHIGKGEVIKGWDEGVSTMSLGGERRLTIPPDLAYGSGGFPPKIPANATLTFEVKLLDIIPVGSAGYH